MTKNIKTIMIICTVLLTPVILLGIYILYNFATDSIYDNTDHNKFTTLDSQMQKVYNKVKTASSGTDSWQYDTLCSPNQSGWMPTGTYNCVSSISMQKVISSVTELNSMQSQYYPIIDSSDVLVKKTELDPEPTGEFGVKLVVSSAEKEYTEVKTGVVCRYLIELNQTDENTDLISNNEEYGSNIENNEGELVLSLRCDETARDHWYELVQSTSELIP